MGMPMTKMEQFPEVQQLPNQEFLMGPRCECPKYNWTKMDPYERVGVNLMDAVGARNAVFGGLLGLLVMAVVIIFFREKLGKFILSGIPGDPKGK